MFPDGEDPMLKLENRNRQIDLLNQKTEERICEAESHLEHMIKSNYKKLKIEMEGGEQYVQEMLLK